VAELELRELLKQAIAVGASDLHCSAGGCPRVRIDGELRPLLGAPVVASEWLFEQLTTLLEPIEIERLKSADQTDCACELSEVGRVRCNIFRHARGWGAAFRIIPTVVPSLDSLDLPTIVSTLTRSERGLILVTGPTGSGKSTTLAAMVDHINRNQGRHIVTIEDPIEFMHTPHRSLIHQREVGAHVGSFAEALRAALREDPDVLLVGELRDLETTRLALTAAETGHLVLASLHSSSAPGTLDRIVDIFPATQQAQVRSMLSESIQAIISQILIPRVGRGRVALAEIIVGTPAVRTLIRDAKTHQLAGVMQTSRGVGMQTKATHLQYLIKHGFVDSENLLQEVE
jgi:twitching motility protein PilT